MKRKNTRRPPLTIPRILAWADAHFRATGTWPGVRSGRVRAAANETWAAIDLALRDAWRGLPGGSSLARLLAQSKRRRNHMALPVLTEAQILAWADAHYARTERWPHRDSGKVLDKPDENWGAINTALTKGVRGLPGGSSLYLLLRRHRNVLLRTTYVPIRALWAREEKSPSGQSPAQPLRAYQGSSTSAGMRMNSSCPSGGGASLRALTRQP